MTRCERNLRKNYSFVNQGILEVVFYETQSQTFNSPESLKNSSIGDVNSHVEVYTLKNLSNALERRTLRAEEYF